MCVSINGPGDPDLCPFDLETGVRVASKVGNLRSKFGHAIPLGSRIIRMYATDGRTNGQKQRLLPFPYGGAGIIVTHIVICCAVCSITETKRLRQIYESDIKNYTSGKGGVGEDSLDSSWIRPWYSVRRLRLYHTDAVVELSFNRRELLLHRSQSQLSAPQTRAGAVPQSGLQRPGLWPDRLDRLHPAPLLGQLGPRLRVRIEQREVGHDHRNRKRYREHAGQRAQRPDEHSEIGLGHHVAVADRRHGYNSPPQTDGDRVEVVRRIMLRPLGVEDERREDNDAEDEEKDEEAEFVGASLKRVDEDLESGGMPRQLEQSHDPDDAEKLENLVLFAHARHHKVDVERQRRDDVDNVDL